MRKTVVLNVVGLSPTLLRSMPRLAAWASRGKVATIDPQLPAVTCTAQATYLTGQRPEAHGIVANGWYFHDECEIKFWRQSNRLVQAPKIWELAKAMDPGFTCANLFWWFNMYSSVDVSVTPRPMYPADGRKIPDLYTQPASLRDELQAELGPFPLFEFWGPRTSIRSSQWIAEAAKRVEARLSPTLTLVYMPHLDYALQRRGPAHPENARDLQDIDGVSSELIAYYEAQGAQVVVLSEYGITPVCEPVALNRILREHGLLRVREELGRELLDAGASAAFAVADHQVAHVYVNNPEVRSQVRRILQDTPGVEQVLAEDGKAFYGLNHSRSGDFVAIARADAWFSYYYWLDDRKAPDFARTVDIHRKPGYDPVELFIDPAIRFPELKVAWTLLKKQLGFRTLMEVIPLDASLAKGSHGRPTDDPEDGPLLITRQSDLVPGDRLTATEVFGVLLQHLAAEVWDPLPRHV